MSKRLVILFLVIAALLAGGLWLFAPDTRAPAEREADRALLGEARRGGLRAGLQVPLADIAITDARLPEAPLVLIDPGHGGRDGGAQGVGGASENALTLAMAREVQARLVERGRVRTALSRTGDDTLSLEQRADLARRLAPDLFVSIHMDAAPNPDATGVTIYSLADIASTTEAADLAAAEAERVGTVVSDTDSKVEFLLTDLALRDQMAASAAFARRFLRRAEQDDGVPLRPTPHQFANFYVLRFAQVPGALVEAGYLSNRVDEARLRSKEGRAPLVEALAEAIEADLAARLVR
ncbi:N-acetylmuramoyl-L-alanine amidase [Sphingomicrobium sp. XHP0235]|uniref:N-acetylmuramoyl-L-alanine amidase family protein n=1 Tax=Sphingomicrobium aquimarinum TaxID=3133971 RepID=UPI0031FF1B8E